MTQTLDAIIVYHCAHILARGSQGETYRCTMRKFENGSWNHKSQYYFWKDTTYEVVYDRCDRHRIKP